MTLSKENKRRKPLTAELGEISSRGQTSKRLIAFFVLRGSAI